MPSPCATIVFQGSKTGDIRNPLRSQDRLAFFASQKPFRRCASRAFGYFRHESNIIHDTANNLLIEGVGKVVILYCTCANAILHGKAVQNDNMIICSFARGTEHTTLSRRLSGWLCMPCTFVQSIGTKNVCYFI